MIRRGLKRACLVLAIYLVYLVIGATAPFWRVPSLPPEEETSLCKATDEVYAFVFDGELRKGALVELGARGDGGSKTFSIPESWSTADLYVYAFARARRGRKASPTALLYPAE